MQPADAVIWHADEDAGYSGAQVDYIVIPPNDHVVDLVCPGGQRFRLDRDHPVVAVRGGDWQLWLDSSATQPAGATEHS